MRSTVIVVLLTALLTLNFGYSVQAGLESSPVIWDTVGNGTVRLAVSNHGSMGLNGIGGANMDFTSSGIDCDPNANVYLYSGGPFIIQKIDSAAGVFSWSTGLYQNDAIAPFSFSPDPSGPPSSHFIGPDGSDAFFTGRFLNWDSTIGMERTYYAPTTGVPNDNFIIVRTDIYPLDGLDHPDLAIGEVIDWKIPSDNNGANVGEIAGSMVYLRGTDSGSATGCQLNRDRFGSSFFLGMHTSSEFNLDSCANNRRQQSIYAIDNFSEIEMAPNGILDSELVWNTASLYTGEWVLVDTAADQRIYSTFVQGYTLTASDTLTVYTALISQQLGLVQNFDQSRQDAQFWFGENLLCGGIVFCCKSSTGNIDGDPNDITDIRDLTFLIDHLFINFPLLPCPAEGNIDGDPDGIVDITDLTALVSHLFICFGCLPAPCAW